MKQDDPPAVPKAEAAYIDKRLRRIVRAKSKTPLAQRRYQSTHGATPSATTHLAGSQRSACEDKRTIAHTSIQPTSDAQEVAATSETPREQDCATTAGDGYRLSPPEVHVVSYERYRFFRRVCLFGALGTCALALWLIVTPQYESEPSAARVSTESMMDSPGSAPVSAPNDVTTGPRDSSAVDARAPVIAERDSSVTSEPPPQQGSALTPPAAAAQPSDATTPRSRTVVKAQTPTPKRSASATPAALHGTSGPVLYIRVRSESQRARAERMIQPLAKRGIRVTDIKLVDAGPPVADVRYFDPDERDGAVRIALALRELGVSAQRLQQVSGSETLKGQRRFELWLSSAAP